MMRETRSPFRSLCLPGDTGGQRRLLEGWEKEPQLVAPLIERLLDLVRPLHVQLPAGIGQPSPRGMLKVSHAYLLRFPSSCRVPSTSSEALYLGLLLQTVSIHIPLFAYQRQHYRHILQTGHRLVNPATDEQGRLAVRSRAASESYNSKVTDLRRVSTA